MAVNTKLLQEQYEDLLADNARMKFRITELESQLKELREVTPRMLKASQLGSELGVIATSKYAGAYDIMAEMYQVMFDAAIKEQDDE